MQKNSGNLLSQLKNVFTHVYASKDLIRSIIFLPQYEKVEIIGFRKKSIWLLRF